MVKMELPPEFKPVQLSAVLYTGSALKIFVTEKVIYETDGNYFKAL
jgi:hypothetical protein